MRLLDWRDVFLTQPRVAETSSLLSQAIPVSVGGLKREQTHLCLPSTCLREQRSASRTGHWAHISGPSQETHTHSADRAQPSVTKDTDKAPLLLPHASPQMKVGPGSQRPPLAQWPPHPPRPRLGRSAWWAGLPATLSVSVPQGIRKPSVCFQPHLPWHQNQT